MRRITKLPANWMQRVEKSIRDGESPFDTLPSEIAGPVRQEIDEYLRQELASAERQKDMLRFLRMEVVESAAEYLWKATEARPSVQKKVTVYIHRALYRLSKCTQPPTKDRSATDVRRTIETLEQVRDDTTLLVLLGGKTAAFQDLLGTAIEFYRLQQLSARRTKPKETGQRIALAVLRYDFSVYFGSPMNQAVAYFMEAAFGGSWDANTVRTRAAEWK